MRRADIEAGHQFFCRSFGIEPAPPAPGENSKQCEARRRHEKDRANKAKSALLDALLEERRARVKRGARDDLAGAALAGRVVVVLERIKRGKENYGLRVRVDGDGAEVDVDARLLERAPVHPAHAGSPAVPQPSPPAELRSPPADVRMADASPSLSSPTFSPHAEYVARWGATTTPPPYLRDALADADERHVYSDMCAHAYNVGYKHWVRVPDDEVPASLRFGLSPDGHWHPPGCICGRPTCPTPA